MRAMKSGEEISGYDGSRPGEILADADPAATADDARLVFIGSAQTPWTSRRDCPHNLRQARERGGTFAVAVKPEWRAGLRDLKAGDPVILLYWMDQAARNVIIQAPRHSQGTKSVFSLRSPARPNPIALAAVRILAIDHDGGRIEVDALDCLDGTPIIDIKPWIARVDVPPE